MDCDKDRFLWYVYFIVPGYATSLSCRPLLWMATQRGSRYPCLPIRPRRNLARGAWMKPARPHLHAIDSFNNFSDESPDWTFFLWQKPAETTLTNRSLLQRC
ncbi:hypothetical protein BJY04DRAFT_198149 [Aspergillus karnatakaensis]|uniref:uncharacterized protein n=1 Tax=Aspergillus karnatakaensis TaxID=1810916 RepID=UPI003CCD636E